MTLTVSDGTETVTTTCTVEVNQDMSGTWNGTIVGVTTTYTLTVTFSQNGTTLTGTYELSGLGTVVGGNISVGDISSTNNFVCPCDVAFDILGSTSGFRASRFTGTVNAGVTSLSGVFNGSGFVNASTTLAR